MLCSGNGSWNAQLRREPSCSPIPIPQVRIGFISTEPRTVVAASCLSFFCNHSSSRRNGFKLRPCRHSPLPLPPSLSSPTCPFFLVRSSLEAGESKSQDYAQLCHLSSSIWIWLHHFRLSDERLRFWKSVRSVLLRHGRRSLHSRREQSENAVPILQHLPTPNRTALSRSLSLSSHANPKGLSPVHVANRNGFSEHGFVGFFPSA